MNKFEITYSFTDEPGKVHISPYIIADDEYKAMSVFIQLAIGVGVSEQDLIILNTGVVD
jgi:hypothetical protein